MGDLLLREFVDLLLQEVNRKDFERLKHFLVRKGYTLRQGGKHTKVYLGDRFLATLPGTPSDHRSWLNTLHTLKRLGIITRDEMRML